MPDKPLKFHVDFTPLEALAKESPAIFNSAMKKGAIQFLTWANTGTGKSSKKPPIRWGILRGSSSAFVGGELVLIFPQTIKSGSNETPTPAKTHTAKDMVSTFVWNTDYAAKMHEWQGGWGERTTDDGDAGNKWVEDHLKSDKELWLDFVGSRFKKEAGL